MTDDVLTLAALVSLAFESIGDKPTIRVLHGTYDAPAHLAAVPGALLV